MKYTKDTARLTVQYVNSETEDIVFQVTDRTWMTVGELLSDHYVTEVMKQNKIETPNKLMVLVIGEFTLNE